MVDIPTRKLVMPDDRRKAIDQNDIRGLLTEIESAETWRDNFLTRYKDIMASLVGPSYNKSELDGEILPDNRFFEFATKMLASVAFQPPNWDVSTSMPFLQGDVARAIEVGLDQWTKDELLIEPLRRVMFDMLIGWGVMRVTARPDESGLDSPTVMSGVATGVPWRPLAERIDNRDHFRDPRATWWGNARFEGHRWVIDKDHLLAIAEQDDSWNKRAIEALTPEALLESKSSRPKPDNISRNDLVLTDMFSAEFFAAGEPEDGETGGLLTLADASQYDDDENPAPLREVQPWIGHPQGPYVTFGVYDLPGYSTPLGPITAAEEIVRSLNRQSRAIIESDDEYAKFIATSSQKLQDLMADGEHHHVYHVEGLDEDTVMQELEKGGSNAQQHVQREFASNLADRQLGLSDAVRGNVTGQGTASENLIAAESAGLFVAWLRQRSAEATARVGQRAAYLMYHRDDIVFAVADTRGRLEGFEQAGEGGDMIFHGGTDGGQGAFRTLEIAVRPASMERQDPQTTQVNTVTVLNIIAQNLPLMLQMGAPEAWIEWSRKLGEAFQVEGVDRIVQAHLTGESDRIPTLASDIAGRAGFSPGALGGPQVGGPIRAGAAQSGPSAFPQPQQPASPGLGSAPRGLQGVVPGVQKRLGL